MTFVYHGVPKEMAGETLFPLNQLAGRDPALYEFQKSKYEGREAALDFRIPGVDLLWTDTLHCSPLHPFYLRSARRELGLLPAPGTALPTWWTGLFFEIPLERILVYPVVWYTAETLWINGAPGEDVPTSPPIDEFEPFDPMRYRPLSDVTNAHRAYLKRIKERGQRPLMFVHIPHVLVGGPVDVRGLRRVSWDSPPDSVENAQVITGNE